MAVSVERLYRVTIGTRALTLDGEQAHSLTMGLLIALDIAPADVRPDVAEVIAADIAPPAQLPSGPVIAEQADDTPAARAPAEAPAGGRPGTWGQADTDRLRVLAAEGLTGPKIAAAMGKPVGTIYAKAGSHRIQIGAKKRAEPVAAPIPPAASDEWTDAQSRYLVELMTRPHASMQYATTCCGHSFVQTSKRWGALKAAGIASVAEWDAAHEQVSA
jgi:hypothetical protein